MRLLRASHIPTHRQVCFTNDDRSSIQQLDRSLAWEKICGIQQTRTASTTAEFFLGLAPAKAKLPAVVSIPRDASVSMLS